MQIEPFNFEKAVSNLARAYATGYIRLNRSDVADAILVIVSTHLRRGNKWVALLVDRYGESPESDDPLAPLDFLGGCLYR